MQSLALRHGGQGVERWTETRVCSRGFALLARADLTSRGVGTERGFYNAPPDKGRNTANKGGEGEHVLDFRWAKHSSAGTRNRFCFRPSNRTALGRLAKLETPDHGGKDSLLKVNRLRRYAGQRPKRRGQGQVVNALQFMNLFIYSTRVRF
jgi:hypothetical protein